MESRNIQAEVIDLLADERGLAADNVQLSHRLLQDLGMDGDDAVDFFLNVQERFGTDLTHLEEHWSEHFGPEGFSCWNWLVIGPATLIGILVMAVADLAVFWGIAITVALLAAWLWAMHRWVPDRMVPVTVRDVVVAVEAGAWPNPPQA